MFRLVDTKKSAPWSTIRPRRWSLHPNRCGFDPTLELLLGPRRRPVVVIL